MVISAASDSILSCLRCDVQTRYIILVLNLPINLPKEARVLHVGCGGGYDILGAVPLQYSLPNHSVFANLGAHNFDHLGKFYPLDHLAGVQPLVKQLTWIANENDIDTFIVVDGGVDVLMRGDEDDAGTVLQDFVILAAIDQLKGQKILASIGFGAETEENVNHYRVLENIASLAAQDAFLGACALTRSMESFKRYQAACDQSWRKRKSHIHSRVISAVEGGFGDLQIEGVTANLLLSTELRAFVNPLMSLYWFFDLSAVARQNLIIEHLKDTQTMSDAFQVFRSKVTRTRDHKPLPI